MRVSNGWLFYGLAAIAVAVCGGVGYRTNPGSFANDLFVNLAAELLGVTLGITVGLMIARRIAGRNFDSLAPEIVKLVATLRRGGAIKGDAARQSVVCSVGLLSKDRLNKARESGGTPRNTAESCAVCDLPVQVRIDPSNCMTCMHCGLRGDVWKAASLTTTTGAVPPGTE